MRPGILVLLVTASVSCNFFESEKSDIVGSLKVHMKGKIFSRKVKLASRIKQVVDNIPLLREKLNKKTLRTAPVLSEEQKKFLEEQKSLGRRLNGKTRRRPDSIEQINARSGIIDSLFQGDMLLSIDQQNQFISDNSLKRFKRQAHNSLTYPEKRWPKNVTYSLDGNLGTEAKKVFRKAVELWTNNTCINFEEDKEETAEDLLLVYKEHGCWAEVGRQIGIAAHELAHALGFLHTHSRYDRDQFITVLDENIQLGRRDQFVPETTETNNNYDLPYDYGSLMHYGMTEFVNNTAENEEKFTIIPKDIMYTETLGSQFISFYDLLMMNMYYNCTDTCKHEPNADKKCRNGGFAHPRNCSECICPSGYGGQFCDERPPGCGAVLNASKIWKTLEDPLNSTMVGPDGYIRCNFWIMAPERAQIEVEIVEVPTALYYKGCRNAGVEIKTHKDQRLTGYRFCSMRFINRTLISHSTVVPVITYIHKNFSEGEDPDEGNVEDGDEDSDEDDDEGYDEDDYSGSEEDEEGGYNGSDYRKEGANGGEPKGGQHLHRGVKLNYRYI